MYFACDCFVLGFTGFGIVLGVEWLQRYGVVVDCEGSSVTIRADDGWRVVLGCLLGDEEMASFYIPSTSRRMSYQMCLLLASIWTSLRK